MTDSPETEKELPEDHACWMLHDYFPTISADFCASLANGHGRCRKGTCDNWEASP